MVKVSFDFADRKSGNDQNSLDVDFYTIEGTFKQVVIEDPNEFPILFTTQEIDNHIYQICCFLLTVWTVLVVIEVCSILT